MEDVLQRAGREDEESTERDGDSKNGSEMAIRYGLVFHLQMGRLDERGSGWCGGGGTYFLMHAGGGS